MNSTGKSFISVTSPQLIRINYYSLVLKNSPLKKYALFQFFHHFMVYLGSCCLPYIFYTDLHVFVK